MNKSSIAAIAVIALIGGAAISWFINSNRPIQLEAGTWFGEQARALPEFELVDHNNHKLKRADFDGKWNLIFFGFTHCPDICPVSLQALDQMMAAIDDPDVADALQVFFVSVDPERDTPEILKSYVTYFNADFIGATAPLVDLRPLTRSLGIMHEIRKPSAGGTSYDVDHSGAIVLVSPDGEFSGVFGAPHDAMALARDMTRIVEYN